MRTTSRVERKMKDIAVEAATRSNPDFEGDRPRASRSGIFVFGFAVFAIAFIIVLAVYYLLLGRIGILALTIAALLGGIAASSIHMVLEWEKAVVLRFGKFNRVSGPGLIFTWPIIEYYTLRVDQRVSATYFTAEETLSSDLVPVNVNAVLFWMVFDPQKAAVEVEDYSVAVSWVAQTSMRKAIGRLSLAEVATRRDQLDAELKEEIEQKLSDWGIDIIDVEIRDIVIPKELQEAMSYEAIANRVRNGRMALAEAEKDISEMISDASQAYVDNPEAMKLRTMHLAYESVQKSGGTLVIPSAFSEGFTDVDSRAKAGDGLEF